MRDPLRENLLKTLSAKELQLLRKLQKSGTEIGDSAIAEIDAELKRREATK